MGIRTDIFYKWRARYGDVDTSMMTCMKEFEEEMLRLMKRCVDAHINHLLVLSKVS